MEQFRANSLIGMVFGDKDGEDCSISKYFATNLGNGMEVAVYLDKKQGGNEDESKFKDGQRDNQGDVS